MKKKLYLLLLAGISIVLPVSFPEMAVHYFDMANDDEFYEVLVVLAVCTAIMARIHIYFVTRVFDRRLLNITRLKYLIASYLYTIVAFAGLYFLLIFIFDFVDAENDYLHYQSIALHASAEDLQYVLDHNLRVSGQKAFLGIANELWIGVDSWELPANLRYKEIKGPGPVPLASIIQAAKAERSSVIQYRSNHRWRVYGDCLYLSAITVATVGYGDIAPANFYAKFLVALEVMIGQIIMVIGLGTVFSNIFKAATKGS